MLITYCREKNTGSSPSVEDDLVIPSDTSDTVNGALGNDVDDTVHTPPPASREIDNHIS